jgi:RNA polymerase sigma-70 factor (ECF subfamily)
MTTIGINDGNRHERFRSLYQKYYLRMVRFYMRAFHVPQEDAEELTQEAFVRFYRSMDEYRGDAEWAFLETIARNLGYNQVRSQRAAKRNGGQKVEMDDPEFANEREPAAPEEPDYAERQEQAMRSRQLHVAIALLPVGQRQCLQLWLDDFTYDEIAASLRISADAVKSRVRDAKRLLRARLGDHVLPEEKE